MNSRRQRQAELVALMLYDQTALRSEFWRVVYNSGQNRPLARLPNHEIIKAILEVEYPAEESVTAE